MSATDSAVREPHLASSSCRACGEPLGCIFADLGTAPLSNSYLTAGALKSAEVYYPLRVWVCSKCFLVQLDEYEKPEKIFCDYAYFSSYSDSWLEHCRAYAESAIARSLVERDSLAVEIASNDGYLLQYFVSRGIPVLGIEPAENVAKVARGRGIRTEARFFGRTAAAELLQQYGPADLMIANNVLAHVPDLHDFIEGFRIMLAPAGRISFEFPHLLELVRHNQFDTIYHEHFSYLSITALQPLFAGHELSLIDVEKLPTHGGSLRVWVAHAASGIESRESVERVRKEEDAAGLSRLDTYQRFQNQVVEVKRQFLSFLLEAQTARKRVVAYGAAAKGNTLLNYCGVRSDAIDYVVDRNPYKQGRYLPGSRIPIHAPDRVRETKPDFIVILPWNITDEVKSLMQDVREWGCRFVTAVPDLRID